MKIKMDGRNQEREKRTGEENKKYGRCREREKHVSCARRKKIIELVRLYVRVACIQWSIGSCFVRVGNNKLGLYHRYGAAAGPYSSSSHQQTICMALSQLTLSFSSLSSRRLLVLLQLQAPAAPAPAPARQLSREKEPKQQLQLAPLTRPQRTSRCPLQLPTRARWPAASSSASFATRALPHRHLVSSSSSRRRAGAGAAAAMMKPSPHFPEIGKKPKGTPDSSPAANPTRAPCVGCARGAPLVPPKLIEIPLSSAQI